MKVALVHSYYSSRQPSGENVVVEAQASALRRAGVDVTIVGAATDDLELQPGYRLRTAIKVATGHGLSPLQELRAFEPDVVHVHNLFPNWGSSWLAKWHGPLVATVHNFRPVCIAGTLFRDGKGCTLCPDGNPFQAVRHACYRDSKVASLPLAIRNVRGVAGDELLSRADRVILLSPRAEKLYAKFGLSTNKTVVIPNFVADAGFTPETLPGDEWVYIGRLTHEKGILNLLKHWPADEVLNIYGDGPLKGSVLAATAQNIRYLGLLDHREVASVFAKARGLVFPSEWAEGLPLVYAESLASGRPVVAKSGNSAADDVLDAGLGSVFDSWTEMGSALKAVVPNQQKLGIRAREHYESTFSTRTWLAATLEMYRTVMREVVERA